MILIRADGNEMVGLGHIMRCLSIAEAIKEKGINVSFVLADNKCERLLIERGFECLILNSDYSNLESELIAFSKVIEDCLPDAIVIDSYYVTSRYLSVIKGHTKTIYIDDVMAFPYPVDILINYNIFSDLSEYEDLYLGCKEKPIFLLGTKYVPLRKEFAGLIPNVQPEFARRILVSTGGADSHHVALSFLQYIIRNYKDLCDYTFTFIIGSVNTDKELVLNLADRIPNVNILSNVKNMSQVMLSNDIAISAAGSTLYELCACGIPTITYTLADNQIPAAEAFHEKGIMINAGDLRNDPDNYVKNIISKAKRLCESIGFRVDMSSMSRNVTNGSGANRLVYKMMCDL